MIDPRGMTITEWTDALSLINFNGLRVEPLRQEVDWVHWALNLKDELSKLGFLIPSPEGFKNWRDWAERVNLIR